MDHFIPIRRLVINCDSRNDMGACCIIRPCRVNHIFCDIQRPCVQCFSRSGKIPVIADNREDLGISVRYGEEDGVCACRVAIDAASW